MLSLRRVYSGTHGTFGLLSADGKILCCTLEPVQPVIPAGKYTVSVYDSPHFQSKVFLFNEIPGHTAVEIHAGNTIADTHGCVLVGLYVLGDFTKYDSITGSKIMLKNLLEKYPEGFDIEVT